MDDGGLCHKELFVMFVDDGEGHVSCAYHNSTAAVVHKRGVLGAPRIPEELKVNFLDVFLEGCSVVVAGTQKASVRVLGRFFRVALEEVEENNGVRHCLFVWCVCTFLVNVDGIRRPTRYTLFFLLLLSIQQQQKKEGGGVYFMMYV